MLMWINLFSLLFSMAIFAFNFILLISITINYTKFHCLSNVLSANLWLVNCISSVFTIFRSLFHNLFQQNSTVLNGPENIGGLGPETLNALFNTTVSLLALMSMAFVEIFSHYQDGLPRSAGVRISTGIWAVVAGVLLANFVLVQITQSFAFILAFQLALISIFMMFNLDVPLTNSITQSLWLLMHALSFTLLAIMLVWENNSTSDGWQAKSRKQNSQLISLQLAVYSVHCIANPMIAVLRDPTLATTIARIVLSRSSSHSRTPSIQGESIEEDPEVVRWFLPEMSWIIRNIPPPPPYNTDSIREITQQHLQKQKAVYEQVLTTQDYQIDRQLHENAEVESRCPRHLSESSLNLPQDDQLQKQSTVTGGSNNNNCSKTIDF
uniref:Uncharacterized protein n=1 Tax=Ditylenchus dipsaci TaxID=166011 RepID=A0A915DUK5_9BILA